MAATFILRKINERDFGRVAEITNRYFPHVRATPSRILRRISKGFMYIVAVVNGTVAGFADIKIMKDKVKVMGIAVDEESRHHGVGSALLTVVVNIAVMEGKREVCLKVRGDNPNAIMFYEKNGFAVKKELHENGNAVYLMCRGIET